MPVHLLQLAFDKSDIAAVESSRVYLKSIESLECRVCNSASHLEFASSILPGVAGQQATFRVELVNGPGQILSSDHSNVRFRLKRAGSSKSIGVVQLRAGFAEITTVLPRKAGRFRISAATARASVGAKYSILGGTAVRMKLADAVEMDRGQEGFDILFFDQFGNLATSDTSTLLFRKAEDDGLDSNLTIPVGTPGVVSPFGSGVLVGNGGENPGIASFTIIANGQFIGIGGESPDFVSVTFYDSNPAIKSITSPAWPAES